MSFDTAGLEILLEHERIRDRVHRVARAVDRRDFDLLRSCYWPDAMEEHGAFNGPIGDFLTWLDTRTGGWERTQFSLSQTTIDLRGEEAAVETYFTGFRKRPRAEGGWFDEFVSGRYIDSMTKRGDDWRILRRIVVFDWFRQLPDSAEFEGGPFGDCRRGERAPLDALYELLAAPTGGLTGPPTL